MLSSGDLLELSNRVFSMIYVNPLQRCPVLGPARTYRPSQKLKKSARSHSGNMTSAKHPASPLGQLYCSHN